MKLCSWRTGKIKPQDKNRAALWFPSFLECHKKKINFLKLCAAYRFPPASISPAYLPLFFLSSHKGARTYSDTWKHASSLLMISHPKYERPAVPMVMASLIVCTADTHRYRSSEANMQAHRHALVTSENQTVRQKEEGVQTLAWCRSTPYMESFLAFSRKWVSACAGDIPLNIKKSIIQNTWNNIMTSWLAALF